MKSRIRVDTNDYQEGDFWKPFIDVMATITLVFFFIMIVVIFLTYNLYSQIKAEKEEYEKKITSLQELIDQLDDIGLKRTEYYKVVEKELRNFLGDDVEFDTTRGKLIIHSEVLFEINSSKLEMESLLFIDMLGEALFKVLADNENMSDEDLKIKYIEVVGHTDSIGSYISNRNLSVNRATSLINRLLPQDSLEEKEYGHYFKAAGMSEFEPVPETPEDESIQTAEDRMRNRRIEIEIILNDADIEKAIRDLAHFKELP